ncbi:MAG: fibronectin type III domain-containing protein, partial [Eubacterium sp.]|nr:fibronectin type III domain-containing protein [Eubacterium sp.]
KSVTLSWSKVEGASHYSVQYKNASDSKYTALSSNCTSQSYVVGGLSVGKYYDFRVCAFVAGQWREYSNVVRKQALPPTINVVRFIPESTGLRIKWAKRSDVDGLRLYKSSTANGTYKLLKTFDKSANHYVDTAVKYNTNYYYKLVRYKGSYESGAKVFTGKYVLKTPVITYMRKDAKTILFTFNGDGYQDSFDYSVSSGSNKVAAATVNTTEKTLLLENLDIGESYTVSVREKTKFAAGDYGKLTVIAAPKAVMGVTASLKRRGVRINYNVESEALGYLIYRNDGAGYKEIAKLEGKSTKTFFDNSVKYNTPCTYVVRAYAKSDSGKDVPGDSSAPSASVNMVLSPPGGIKAVRTTPTKITVSWNAADYAGKYDLQYRAKGGKWITVSGIKGQSKVIKKLTLGTKYYFRVRSVNGFGSSAYSKSIKRKLLPPTPEAPEVKTASNGLKVVYKPQKYADSYMIYRSNSAKGKFRYLATVNGHKVKYYKDKTAPNSHCRYKIVCCVSKKGVNYMSARSAAGSLNKE